MQPRREPTRKGSAGNEFMRKSNGIIIAIFVAASVVFLWLWHALQFDLVDNPLDLVVAVVWWVVIAGVCIAIHLTEKRRQERIRTMFPVSNTSPSPRD